ncbi:MAG TPA: glycosyltransferase family 4 protein [Micavibrio sp.]|nr:glycosyltransferase family 4 protein [Micavibrio sp.]
MKILLICSAYPPDIKGGGEISTQLLAEGLARAGHDVTVLSLGSVPSTRIERGINVERAESPNIMWNFKESAGTVRTLIWHALENWNYAAQKLVYLRIKRHNPDIVITSTTENFGGNAWLAAAREKVPCVHILRSYNTMCPRASMFRNSENCTSPCVKCNIISVAKKWASSSVTGVIGLSNHVLTAHLRNGYFPNAKHAILPNFIPTTTKEMLQQNPKTLGEPITLGYIGRLSEEKGLGLLLDAWKRFSSISRLKLLIAGDGDPDYIEYLKDEFAGYDVEFVGWISQDSFFPKIHYLIVPSIWHEPLGRVVLEAYSYGVPVIGSNRGGIPDMIVEGASGFVFDPDDSDSLYRVLTQIEVGAGGYARLSKGAFDRLQHYSEAEMIPKYENFLSEVVHLFRQGHVTSASQKKSK